MKDERTELIIKKEVLRSLGEIFLSFILADKFIKEYAVEEDIDFIPKEFPFSLYAISSKRQDFLPARVRVPDWYLKKLKRKEAIKSFFYHFALLFFPFVVSLSMSLRKIKAKNKTRLTINKFFNAFMVLKFIIKASLFFNKMAAKFFASIVNSFLL